MAIGLTLSWENLESFQAAFDECCSHVDPDGFERGPSADLYMDDKEFLNEWFMSKMQFFQPFGEGNPEPIFLLKGEELKQVKTIREHLKFSLTIKGNLSIPGIGFYLADKVETVSQGPVDILFKFKRSYFRGNRRLEVQVVDISPAHM